MIEIKLQEWQNGYDVVGDYIKRYWEKRGYGPVVISLCTSYDGISYEHANEIADQLNGGEDIEFLNDWWEGEKFIRLVGIKAVSEIDISGGIYKS